MYRTFTAGGAFRSEDSMEVVDAVDLVVKVYGEGYPVQTVVTNAAPKTVPVSYPFNYYPRCSLQ
jgi:hypothetical protein